MDIFTSGRERRALDAIDAYGLRDHLDAAISGGSMRDLPTSMLRDCGLHVAGRLNAFELAMSRHRQARSVRKVEETGDLLRSTRNDLISAVQGMQRRVAEERKDEEHFLIRSLSSLPLTMQNKLKACVGYQWRRSVNDEWIHGNINFIHEVGTTADFPRYPQKRKLTMAQQRREQEVRLLQTWNFFMTSALHSVQEYFREGRAPDDVPETFLAIVDGQGDLNNYSTRFWKPQDNVA